MELTRTFKAISLVTWLTATLERAGQVYTVGIWMTSFWQLAFVNVCKAPPKIGCNLADIGYYNNCCCPYK